MARTYRDLERDSAVLRMLVAEMGLMLTEVGLALAHRCGPLADGSGLTKLGQLTQRVIELNDRASAVLWGEEVGDRRIAHEPVRLRGPP